MIKLNGVLCRRPCLQRVSMRVVNILEGENATSREFCVVESGRRRGYQEGIGEGGASLRRRRSGGRITSGDPGHTL